MKLLTLTLCIALVGCSSPTKNQDSASQTDHNTFQNVSDVLSKLSSVGIGEMSNWHNDGEGYFCHTNFYSFGTNSAKNKMQNNLQCFAESPQSDYIKTIALILNVNNGTEAKAARAKYAEVTLITLRKLAIDIPAKLEKALVTGKKFNNTTKGITITNEVHNDLINWYKLVITSN